MERRLWLLLSIIFVLGFTLFGVETKAHAQSATLEVTAGILNVGQSIQITYTNAAKAGKTITITIDDGKFPVPTLYTIEVTLDAHGKATVNWTVPECDVLHFNAPGAREVSRVVVK